MTNKHIIPVTYLGGTGARFLTYLLTSAKLSINEKIRLSHFGNAHYGLQRDMKHTPWGIEDVPSSQHIEHILAQQPENLDNAPFFVTAHILDLDLALETFEKVIRVTYDEDDMDEINKVFLGKFGLDDYKIKMTPKDFLVFRMKSYVRLKPYFTRRPELEPRVLFVSWKELVHSDATTFIKKLSDYTNIPSENFNLENLLHWRGVTLLGVDEINQLIADPK